VRVEPCIERSCKSVILLSAEEVSVHRHNQSLKTHQVNLKRIFLILYKELCKYTDALRKSEMTDEELSMSKLTV
jgi:hypothetical protein